ncbi:MAG: ABC transporter ATP-binding protein [Deltaproteobacteria bacterium]|nr:ABC transporter ATP-binding protein [Deltaproteobacteria bacterium]
MTCAQLALCAVSKTYDGHPVLSEVSFRILAGEHTALLGPSGCGKSTVLRLLAGLEAPSVGEVLMDSHVVSQPQRVLLPPHRRGISMVFQDLALWPNLSVMDNVLLGLAGAGLSKQERRKRAQEALALCAIESLGDRKPSQLSGGQQQRVALARAIAVQPTYLLLDEPFSGLDLVTKAVLLKEISVLAANRKLTIILVTHDPVEATALCRSVLILENGRVQEGGVLEDLLRIPQSETLRVFRSHLWGTEPRLGS